MKELGVLIIIGPKEKLEIAPKKYEGAHALLVPFAEDELAKDQYIKDKLSVVLDSARRFIKKTING